MKIIIQVNRPSGHLEFCTRTKKNQPIRTLYHIYIMCSDWMIIEYKYETHIQKFYGCEVWVQNHKVK